MKKLIPGATVMFFSQPSLDEIADEFGLRPIVGKPDESDRIIFDTKSGKRYSEGDLLMALATAIIEIKSALG